MTQLAELLQAFAGLALLISVGAAAAWRGLLSRDRVSVLSEVTIALLFPVFAFWNGAGNLEPTSIGQAPWMVLIGITGTLAGFLVASVVTAAFRWDRRRTSVVQVMASVGNTGFLGIPLCTALFGADGAVLALLYDFGSTLVFFSLALPTFEQRDGFLGWRPALRTTARRLLNPVSMALFLGLGIAVAGWSLPAVVAQPLEDLAGIVVPMMMLTLGGIMYHFARQGRLARRDALLPVVIKLIVMPLIVLVGVELLPLLPVARGVAVVQAAMPCLMSGAVFAERYGADSGFAASTTMISTALSALTVPLFAALL